MPLAALHDIEREPVDNLESFISPFHAVKLSVVRKRQAVKIALAIEVYPKNFWGFFTIEPDQLRRTTR